MIYSDLYFLQALFYADQLLSKAPISTQEDLLHSVNSADRRRLGSPGIPLAPIQTNKQFIGKVF